MKKKVIIMAMMGAAALSMSACGGKTAETTAAATEAETTTAAETTEAESTEAASESASGESVTVEAMTNSLAIDGSMDDVSFAASFDPTKDITKDGDKYMLHYEGYYQLEYDASDIDALKAGDHIVVGEGDLEVTSIEKNGDFIEINHGLEEGGCTLTSTDHLSYYEVGMSDIGTYGELGEATLPISTDCTITSCFDDPQKTDTLTVEELMENTNPFTEYNTTITVSGGEITAIERRFQP